MQFHFFQFPLPIIINFLFFFIGLLSYNRPTMAFNFELDHWFDTQNVSRVMVIEAAAQEQQEIVRASSDKLFQLALHNQVQELTLLLNQGISIDSKDSEDRTALMYAVKSGQIDTLNILIERGAQLELRNSSGHTALMYAAYFGNLKAVKLLLDAGADPSKKQYFIFGNNALDEAKEGFDKFLIFSKSNTHSAEYQEKLIHYQQILYLLDQQLFD